MLSRETVFTKGLPDSKRSLIKLMFWGVKNQELWSFSDSPYWERQKSPCQKRSWRRWTGSEASAAGASPCLARTWKSNGRTQFIFQCVTRRQDSARLVYQALCTKHCSLSLLFMVHRYSFELWSQIRLLILSLLHLWQQVCCRLCSFSYRISSAPGAPGSGSKSLRQFLRRFCFCDFLLYIDLVGNSNLSGLFSSIWHLCW